MAPKNYYEILGVKTDAEVSEIKAAYRKLVRQYHPDSGLGDRELFEAVTEAYQVLSDDKQRQVYNLRINAEDDHREKVEIYEKAKEQAEAAQKAKEKKQQATKAPQKDTAKDNWINDVGSTLDNVGRSFKRFFQNDPEGSFGGKSHGKQTQQGRESSGIYSKLRGEREYIFTLDAMESIRGATRELALEGGETPRIIRVKVPAGVSQGSRLTLPYPSQGKMPAGRVRIMINVTPHETVERSGLDVILKVPVSVSEAISGTNIEIPTVGGRTKVRVPPLEEEGKIFRLKGRGVKSPTEDLVGDLYVRPFVVVPPGSSSVIIEAAKAMDPFYTRDIRADLPQQL